MNTPSIAVTYSDAQLQSAAKKIADDLSLPLVSTISNEFPIYLVLTPKHLQLQLSDEKAPGPVYVDFISGSLGHRLRFGGGRRQLIGRAVGIVPKETLKVLDVTAGLGRDAYIFATLGCDVTMLERSPIIVALLRDGLKRAAEQKEFSALRLKLIHDEAINYLQQLDDSNYPDVIYCDPMFPPLKKSAAVKKEMRVLKEVVGEDVNSDELLAIARGVAKKRVVVKRHRHSSTIGDTKPDLEFLGKSTRFDVYLPF